MRAMNLKRSGKTGCCNGRCSKVGVTFVGRRSRYCNTDRSIGRSTSHCLLGTTTISRGPGRIPWINAYYSYNFKFCWLILPTFYSSCGKLRVYIHFSVPSSLLALSMLSFSFLLYCHDTYFPIQMCLQLHKYCPSSWYYNVRLFCKEFKRIHIGGLY
jgi:hypothetical protein